MIVVGTLTLRCCDITDNCRRPMSNWVISNAGGNVRISLWAFLIIIVFGLAACSRQCIVVDPTTSPATTQPDQPDEFIRLIRESELHERSRAIGHLWSDVRAQFTS